MSTTPDLLPAEAPAPRLCHLIKIPTFDGYGFNLHAEKSRPGQFIGKVDSGSPAELAGMLEGDRIVEVNGVNIASENHKQVVERIRAVPDETRLLVVDSATDAWYTEHKLVPRSTQDNVRYIRTPTGAKSSPTAPNGHAPQEAEQTSLPSTQGARSLGGGIARFAASNVTRESARNLSSILVIRRNRTAVHVSAVRMECHDNAASVFVNLRGLLQRAGAKKAFSAQSASDGRNSWEIQVALSRRHAV
ncbi:hypothetical protein V5799_033576 [Amblyomma americanum]|uniref:PDZ domain-containing protein n=1 Tax=Amblyomma americanum TaxID=6943 RepID=A0AAQ4DMX1_AMBAM